MKVSRSARSAVAGLAIALLLGGLLAVALGYPPIAGLRALLHYSLGTGSKRALTVTNAVPLLLTGLSAAIAFASGPVNLGQPGQVLMGALAAVTLGLHLHLPPAVQVPALIAASTLGGAAWAGVAAMARRRLGMDEFIVTLMLNEVARLFCDWVISSPLQDRGAGSVTTRTIDRAGFIPQLGGWSASVAIGAVAVIVAWIVCRRLVVGYEWRMAGQAPLFARLGGVEVDRNYSAALAFSGGFAGLAGGVLLLAGPHRFVKGLGGNYGWDGVMIAVVAVNALLGVVLYGLLFSALQTGAIGMEILADIPAEFIQILQAIIVLVTVAARGALTEALGRRSAGRLARRQRAAATGADADGADP